MIISKFIHEQPLLVVRPLLDSAIELAQQLPTWTPEHIYLVGTGSSMNAILAAASCFQNQNARVSILSPMEYLKSQRTHTVNRTLAFVVSQSGESVDTVAATSHLMESGAHVVAITADQNSSLAKLNPNLALLPVSDELVGPKTKGYMATVLILQLYGRFLADKQLTLDSTSISTELSNFISQSSNWVKNIVPKMVGADVILVLGQGNHYGTALEGSLKIAEMSGIPSFGLETEEASHGRFHGVTENSCVIFIVADDVEMEFALRLKNALSQFQLQSFILDMTGNDQELGENSLSAHFTGTEFPQDVLASVIPFQLLAVALAEAKGIVPEEMRYPDLGKYLGIKIRRPM